MEINFESIEQGARLVEVNGHQYLIARVDEKVSTRDLLATLKTGSPVVCPESKRGQLTGAAKAAQVFTRQRRVAPGFYLFSPTMERVFK